MRSSAVLRWVADSTDHIINVNVECTSIFTLIAYVTAWALTYLLTDCCKRAAESCHSSPGMTIA